MDNIDIMNFRPFSSLSLMTDKPSTKAWWEKAALYIWSSYGVFQGFTAYKSWKLKAKVLLLLSKHALHHWLNLCWHLEFGWYPFDFPLHFNNNWPGTVPRVVVGVSEIVKGAVLSGSSAPHAPDVFSVIYISYNAWMINFWIKIECLSIDDDDDNYHNQNYEA